MARLKQELRDTLAHPDTVLTLEGRPLYNLNASEIAGRMLNADADIEVILVMGKMRDGKSTFCNNMLHPVLGDPADDWDTAFQQRVFVSRSGGSHVTGHANYIRNPTHRSPRHGGLGELCGAAYRLYWDGAAFTYVVDTPGLNDRDDDEANPGDVDAKNVTEMLATMHMQGINRVKAVVFVVQLNGSGNLAFDDDFTANVETLALMFENAKRRL